MSKPMSKKKYTDMTERLACAALNLLSASGVVRGDIISLFCMAGRQEELIQMLDKSTAKLIEEGKAKEEVPNE